MCYKIKLVIHIYYFKSSDEDQIHMKRIEEGVEERVTSWQVERKQENPETDIRREEKNGDINRI